MGIGSSQHLYARGFLSNGPQASLVPVGTGIGLHQKHIAAPRSRLLIGEGLRARACYEALNLAALWNVPQLFICENNLYSQSTPQAAALAGTIRGRAEAFGLRYFEADTWNVAALVGIANDAIDYVRAQGRPAFLTVRTYRLNAHSKGDDDRDLGEIAVFRERDPLNRLLARSEFWRANQAKIRNEIDAHIANSPQAALTALEYVHDHLPRLDDSVRIGCATIISG